MKKSLENLLNREWFHFSAVVAAAGELVLAGPSCMGDLSYNVVQKFDTQ